GFLERLDGELLVAALDERPRLNESLQHVRGSANLYTVAAREKIGVECGQVWRAVMRPRDDESSRLGRGIVARLDPYFRVGDRVLQRLRAASGRRFGTEIDAYAAEHRVQHCRIDHASDALDH